MCVVDVLLRSFSTSDLCCWKSYMRLIYDTGQYIWKVLVGYSRPILQW